MGACRPADAYNGTTVTWAVPLTSSTWLTRGAPGGVPAIFLCRIPPSNEG